VQAAVGCGCHLLVLLCVQLLPLPAMAHAGGEGSNPVPIVLGVVLLLIPWAAYCLGSIRIWPGRGRWLLFNAASLVAAFALLGPLDRWAETSTAMHMVQHMLMMVIIAPLWVMSQPLPQLGAWNPRRMMQLCAPPMRLARHPLAAACLHAAVIWCWHAPRPYLLALDNPWWHLAEHASFLVTAGLFWWAVLRGSQRNAGYALLALLFTLMHTGFLGALLTFANASIYGSERDLLSQQLAGLIMWVLGGLPYLAGAGWVGARWFQHAICGVTPSSDAAESD
jgi:putative membrane protein